MKMTFSANVEVFDKNKYLTALREAIRAVFIKGGQKFLLAAVPRIPIWTGMARGALRNLEDLVGKVSAVGDTFRIRGTRGGGSRNPAYRKGYYYYPPGGPRIERSPQAGRLFATPPDQVFNLKGATLASGRLAFYFRYEVDIKYVDILDPVKWQAFKAGAEALEAYVKLNLKLPNTKAFFTRKRVT